MSEAIRPYLVVNETAGGRCWASRHFKLDAAKKRLAKPVRGERMAFRGIFERDVFSLPETCEMPIKFGVFKYSPHEAWKAVKL